jgi:hypothetical protein
MLDGEPDVAIRDAPDIVDGVSATWRPSLAEAEPYGVAIAPLTDASLS